MSATVLPAILDAIVKLATEHLPEGVVSDGYRVGEHYPDTELLVGIQDPFATQDSESGQSSQEWAYTGTTTRDERGTITCAIACRSRDADMATARNAAADLLDQFVELVLPDVTLGVDEVQWVKPGDDITFLQDQDADGALAVIYFRLAFYAQVP